MLIQLSEEDEETQLPTPQAPVSPFQALLHWMSQVGDEDMSPQANTLAFIFTREMIEVSETC